MRLWKNVEEEGGLVKGKEEAYERVFKFLCNILKHHLTVKCIIS